MNPAPLASCGHATLPGGLVLAGTDNPNGSNGNADLGPVLDQLRDALCVTFTHDGARPVVHLVWDDGSALRRGALGDVDGLAVPGARPGRAASRGRAHGATASSGLIA